MKHNTSIVITLSLLSTLFLTCAPFLDGAPVRNGVAFAQAVQPPDPPRLANQPQADQPTGLTPSGGSSEGNNAEPPASTLASVAAVVSANSPSNEWRSECVNCPKQFTGMSDRSLRLDSSGRPHLAYGGNHLYYAWHDGSGWHYETVDEAPMVGKYAALALDGSGRPHIGYYDESHGDLKYAWHDGTSWQVETVDSEGNVGWGISLALDDAGRPHISYTSICQQYSGQYVFYVSDDLKHARRDGNAWQVEIVDSEGEIGYGTSLALDSAGRPHISYSSNNKLKYAAHDGTAWQAEIADSQGLINSPPSLALDSAGRPHISYSSDNRLKYAARDGTAWQVETADSTEFVGADNSLALDGAGHPHISYYDWGTNALKYTRRDGTSWYVETVDNVSYENADTSLALDGAGQPHISYYDEYHGELKYAAGHDGTSWYIETVDSAGYVGTYTSLALDGTGRPHVSYAGWSTNKLQYAAAVSAAGEMAWQVETVNSAGDVDTYTSLALDDAGRPHISYYGDANLRYTWYDGNAWQVEIVDSEITAGKYNSLALDSTGQPHISYQGSQGNLKYARREAVATASVVAETARNDGNAWHIEIVDSEGGLDSSLALDSLGRPHISYHGSDTLKYARREAGAAETAGYDGNAWHVEVVGRSLDSSLALDGAGHPHISYYGSANYDLVYAWHDGTTWYSETVDSEGYVGAYTSLALDDAGRPHISYFDRSNSEIKYARREAVAAGRDGNAWQIETVDSLVWVKQNALAETLLVMEPDYNTSLALDDAGQPHIVYASLYQQYNGIDGPFYVPNDLKYASHKPPLQLSMHTVPGDEVYNRQALTYTLALSGTGANARLWNPLPGSLRYVTDSLSSNLATPAVYSSTAHAIIWQGELPADRDPEIRFQTVVNVQGNGSPFETPAIANTAWLIDTDSGRTISATARLTVIFSPLQLDKQATPADGVLNRDVVTYTLTLSGTGQNATLWDPLPVGVRYVSGSLSSTLNPLPVYSPTLQAITWAGVLPADAPGQVRFQVTRGITGPGSLDLSLPIVNTAWLTDTDDGTHVEAIAIVNGPRLYLPFVMR